MASIARAVIDNPGRRGRLTSTWESRAICVKVDGLGEVEVVVVGSRVDVGIAGQASGAGPCVRSGLRPASWAPN
jgi:hypothetical protein